MVPQDAYMPKDASKLGHRGIGFVTFASPDAVEMVRKRPESFASHRHIVVKLVVCA